MTNETKLAASAPLSLSKSVSSSSREKSASGNPTSKVVLSPGEWIRAVSNVEAPFGFDRMPTVWG